MKSIVLAAGKSSRFKSGKSKVLYEICGNSLIDLVVKNIKTLIDEKPIVVVGFEKEKVKNNLGQMAFYAEQVEQKGTGNAVVAGFYELLNRYSNTLDEEILITCGDIPLLTQKTLSGFLNFHKNSQNLLSFLYTKTQKQNEYGRVIKDRSGKLVGIKEFKECNEQEKLIEEVNVGTYIVNSNILEQFLKEFKNENKKEFYFTDIVNWCYKNNFKSGLFFSKEEESRGINNLVELSEVAQILQKRINENHMLNGVEIVNSNSCIISIDTKIAPGSTIIGPSFISGNTKIGENCLVKTSTLINCQVKNDTNILDSYLQNVNLGSGCQIGPFSYLRPETSISDNVKVGSFVEIKKSTIGESTKIPHLSYVGDATIGKRVNVGCGTIFANFNGNIKQQTIVGNDVFIGCNTNLIAPIEIEDETYIVAGQTLRKTKKYIKKNNIQLKHS